MIKFVPEAYRGAIEKASDRDRRYFLKHPEKTEYIREYVPGEFGDIGEWKPPDVVWVRQVRPGHRVRRGQYITVVNQHYPCSAN